MSLLRSPNPYSYFSAWLIFLSILIVRFIAPVNNILSWDTFGYYLYLPANFIYHDPGLRDMSWIQHILETYQPTSSLYQLYPGADGNMLIKYPVGFAIIYSPFFFFAHGFAFLSGYPADGFSAPYQYMLTVGAMIYTFIGILAFRKVLLIFFNDRLTSIIILCICAGTNYFQMASDTSLLTHNFLFSIYALVVLLTIQWHKKQNFKDAVFLGILIGMATISRPTDGLLLLVPLFWGVISLHSFVLKLKILVNNYAQTLLFAIAATLMMIPQLLYWKFAGGHYLTYTYQNPGEGFDFLNPHTVDFVFSFRKGWLLYTPIMALTFPGFILLYNKNKDAFVPILLFFITYLYVVSSWTCWWYPGTLGQRPMVEIYPILAIPLGYSILWIAERKRKISVPASILIGLLLILNIFQTWQFSRKIIHPERMSRAYYWSVFGQLSANEEDKKLLLVDRPGGDDEVLVDTSGFQRRVLFLNSFENPEKSNGYTCNNILHVTGNSSLQLDSVNSFSPSFSIPFRELTLKYYAWTRFSIQVYPFDTLKEEEAMMVLSFEHKGQPYKYKAEDIAKAQYHVKPGQWNEISVDYITPEVRSKDDRLKVYFWLRSKSTLLLDDMRLEVFD
jgi:hypothetical protein